MISSFAFSPMQSHNPHTFVVITLDPPIRKGQTLYPHIVIQVLYYISIFTVNWIKCSFNRKMISSLCEQFETETVVERELTLSEEVLAEKYKDRLESSYRVIYLLSYLASFNGDTSICSFYFTGYLTCCNVHSHVCVFLSCDFI